jgi:hemoglobin
MAITDREFDAAVAHLKKALEANGVKPGDVEAILGAVEATRKDIVVLQSIGPPKTLWERLGGEENVRRIVDQFVTAAAADPGVNFSRGGKYKFDAAKLADLKDKFVKLASSVGEGPYKYDGRRMLEAHKDMAITDKEFDAAVAHLKRALEKNRVQAEDVEAILGAVEATRKDIVEK